MVVHQLLFTKRTTIVLTKAYWKFNEGKGNNIAKDLTGNGNDAVAYTTAIWPEGIEVPQKNKE